MHQSRKANQSPCYNKLTGIVTHTANAADTDNRKSVVSFCFFYAVQQCHDQKTENTSCKPIEKTEQIAKSKAVKNGTEYRDDECICQAILV